MIIRIITLPCFILPLLILGCGEASKNYQDNFQSYPPGPVTSGMGGWQIYSYGPGQAVIDNTTGANGTTQSLRIDTPSPGESMEFLHAVSDPHYPLTLEMYLKGSNNDSICSAGLLYQQSTVVLAFVLNFPVAPGSISIVGDSGHFIGFSKITYMPGAWYKIALTVDLSKHTYSALINDTDLLQGSFVTTIGGLSDIGLTGGSLSGTTSCWFDEIQIN